MTNSHAHVQLTLTTQRETMSFFRWCCMQSQQIDMINGAALHTRSKQPFGLVMCYFVYKVITNKVFKKVTCQLLGWWIPFPQWKHASAEASNFLSCTPPKLQCRDCLVINRACTVPSLCMRLGIRESEGGWQEFPPMHQTTGLVFSIHCDGYSPPITTPPPSPATPYWPESCSFFGFGQKNNQKTSEDSFIMKV